MADDAPSNARIDYTDIDSLDCEYTPTERAQEIFDFLRKTKVFVNNEGQEILIEYKNAAEIDSRKTILADLVAHINFVIAEKAASDNSPPDRAYQLEKKQMKRLLFKMCELVERQEAMSGQPYQDMGLVDKIYSDLSYSIAMYHEKAAVSKATGQATGI